MANVRDYLLLTTGVAACAASVIFIKASTAHPVVLAGWRLVLAATLLTPFMLWAKRTDPRPFARLFERSWPGALLLAVHFIAWGAGARMTQAANATLVVNLVPVVMPVLLWIMMGERITRREVAGSALSLTGMAVLTVGTVRVSGDTLLGDLVCFVAMILASAYLAIGRLRNEGGSLWLYVVPLYWMAGVLCLALGAVWPGASLLVPGLGQLHWHQWLWLALLALVPTIIGHSLLNYAMRRMRGQVVSVFNLAQFLFAGILAYFCYGEVPSPRFYAASILTVAGALVIVTEKKAPATLPREADLPEE